MTQINKKIGLRELETVFLLSQLNILWYTKPSAPDDIQENMAYGNFLFKL